MKTIADIDVIIFVQIQSIVTSTKECKREIESTIHQLRVTVLSFALDEEVLMYTHGKKLGNTSCFTRVNLGLNLSYILNML